MVRSDRSEGGGGGLRPQLRSFRDERGKELFDVPDGPLPSRDALAAPRFLPEYDNVALAHADRSRILGGTGPGLPFPRGRAIGTLLVDGFYRANWKLDVRGDSATLTVDRVEAQRRDPSGTADEIVAEGLGLCELNAPGSHEPRVEFARLW